MFKQTLKRKCRLKFGNSGDIDREKKEGHNLISHSCNEGVRTESMNQAGVGEEKQNAKIELGMH